MYGIVKVDGSGKPDFSVSSGPFVLEKASEQEIVMPFNP
jgi:hypothetical protein